MDAAVKHTMGCGGNITIPYAGATCRMATRNRQLQAMRGKNMHSVAIDCSDAQELAVTAGALPDDLIVLRYDKSASAAKQKGTGAVV